jgi:hypothetical protein
MYLFVAEVCVPCVSQGTHNFQDSLHQPPAHTRHISSSEFIPRISLVFQEQSVEGANNIQNFHFKGIILIYSDIFLLTFFTAMDPGRIEPRAAC